MIPKAKKNLHACKYHLQNLLKSRHFEEVEINFAAFVNFARSTTFVLQKEFNKDPQFVKWYGDSKKDNVTCKQGNKKNESLSQSDKGTKQHEMENDELCRFFLNLRNKIIKEGISDLDCSTLICAMNSDLDYPDKPLGASLDIGTDGVYYHVHKGTAQEDRIPAFSSTAKIITDIYISQAPTQHLGQKIENPNLITIAQLYYKYLENLVEEWTEIVNCAKAKLPTA